MMRVRFGRDTGWGVAVPSVGPATIGRGSKVGHALSAAVLVLITWGPRTASACSTAAPPPSLVGYPSDTDVQVPTDVVPFYDTTPFIASDRSITQFSLTSSAGDTLAVQTTDTHLYTIDLTIEKALQPNTKYTLVASLSAAPNPDAAKTLTLTFTTGAGPVSAPPDPPQAFLQHYQFGQQLRSSCSPWEEGTCVAVSTGFPLEQTDVYESGAESQWTYLRREPWFSPI